MVRASEEMHAMPRLPGDCADYARSEIFVLQNGALFDVELEVSQCALAFQRRALQVCRISAELFNRLRHGDASGIRSLKVFRIENAGKGSASEICALVTHTFFIGESDDRGGYPRSRAIWPQDLMATIFQSLGMDLALQFTHPSGRPTYMIEEGKPIEELF